MALEDIFRALEEQAEVECEELRSAARAQADSIASEAKEQADDICRAKVEVAEREVRATSAQRLNTARLTGRKLVAGVKDRAIRSSFEGAGGKLAAVRGTPAYASIFKQLAEEAVGGVDGPVEVIVAPDDVELANVTFSELGIAAEVKAESGASGGLVILAAGGTIYRRNTFDDRLARLRECCQAEVAEILLG